MPEQPRNLTPEFVDQVRSAARRKMTQVYIDLVLFSVLLAYGLVSITFFIVELETNGNLGRSVLVGAISANSIFTMIIGYTLFRVLKRFRHLPDVRREIAHLERLRDTIRR